MKAQTAGYLSLHGRAFNDWRPEVTPMKNIQRGPEAAAVNQVVNAAAWTSVAGFIFL